MPKNLNRKSPRRLSVRQLSDDELLSAQLTIKDPTTLENISSEPPAENAELYFEMTYEAPNDVKCVFGHWHKLGLVLVDLQGIRYLVGQDCGRTKFGLEWEQLNNEGERQKTRQDYLSRLVALANALASIDAWLEELARHPSIAAYDALCRRIRNDFPSLHATLRDATVKEPQLYIIVQERDFAAEERQREKDLREKEHVASLKPAAQKEWWKKNGTPSLKPPQIFKPVLRPGMVLQGAIIFHHDQLGHRLAPGIEQLKILKSVAATREGSIDLKGLLQTATLTIDQMLEALGEINQALLFFSYRHLVELAEWLNHRHQATKTSQAELLEHGWRPFLVDTSFEAATDCLIEITDQKRELRRPDDLGSIDVANLRRLRQIAVGIQT